MIALLLSSVLCAASPLTVWGSQTPADSASLSAYLFASREQVDPLVYGTVGLSGHTDLYLGLGPDSLEVFPRVFLFESLAVSPHLYWTPEGTVLAPEIHFNASGARFALTVNAGWRPVLGRKLDVSFGDAYFAVVPEYRFAKSFSVFVEVVPVVSFVGSDPTLILSPGFSLTLDEDGRHGLAVALQTSTLPEVEPVALGICYTYTVPARDQR